MKTVLITGANKGIGFDTAKQIAQQGCFVYIGSRDINNGVEAVNQLKALGITNVEAIEIDVTDIQSIKKAKSELEGKIPALDVLINNAGIAGDQPQNISTVDMDNLRSVFETNYFGAIQTTQQFLPLLKKAAQPSIINVSSELGSVAALTTPSRNPNRDIYDAYASTKVALNSFTILLANELRDTNFSVNSVTPGYTATDLNQFKGAKTAEEGAKTIVWLATKSGPPIKGKFFRDEAEILW